MPTCAKPPPPSRCACCSETGPWSLLDPDLGLLVCSDCRYKLRAAAAWLRCCARVVGCTRSFRSRLRPSGGDA